jgi:hypothetical protein
MTLPTLEDVRNAKAEIIRLLKAHGEFAGAGIGRDGGRLVVHVNWRTLPQGVTLPERIGTVDVSHHVVGNVRPLSVRPPSE